MKHLFLFLLIITALSCGRDVEKQPKVQPKPLAPKIIKEFGFTLTIIIL